MLKFFRADSQDEIAEKVFQTIVGQSRRPAFYRFGQVADSLDGRFDLLVLHAYLVMKRLKTAGQVGQDLAQHVFDIMFDHLDVGLREMGVGDLSVGKKIKKMASAFYGRVDSYEKGLDHRDDAVLKEALLRNLYRVDPAEGEDAGIRPEALEALYVYFCRADRDLADQADKDLLAGRVTFIDFPVEAPDRAIEPDTATE